jgi:signal transduction histidine kinase
MRASRLDNSQTIAGSYLDASDSREKASGGLFPAGVTGMWTIGSDDLRIVAIFSESQIDGIIQAVCDALPAIGGGEIVVGHYASDTPATQAFLSEPIGKQMPGWQISLSLVTPDPFQAAADKQRLVYITIACVAIGVIAVLAGASAKYIRKQMKLTRLKNDFVATVSHELKTPLASMRVLIDTLVAGRITDQAQADEYLQIIARENTRLSRLIDNFLTFSRMERNKCAFEFNKLDVAELVAEAVASAGERFGGAEPCLAVEAAPDLPPITGDQDALVTVILNLLDNAWKYSGDNRKIRLQAVADGQFVCIKVSDNGIGMAPRTVRRIFTRFYQADRKLTALGGCGLGLSIVKFILDAHGGLIEVVSRPGDGSTFIVKLPAQQISKGDS